MVWQPKLPVGPTGPPPGARPDICPRSRKRHPPRASGAGARALFDPALYCRLPTWAAWCMLLQGSYLTRARPARRAAPGTVPAAPMFHVKHPALVRNPVAFRRSRADSTRTIRPTSTGLDRFAKQPGDTRGRCTPLATPGARSPGPALLPLCCQAQTADALPGTDIGDILESPNRHPVLRDRPVCLTLSQRQGAWTDAPP